MSGGRTVKIAVRGLAKRFVGAGGVERSALAGIDLEVRDGELLCLLGPSGCGKSTFLNILAGFERPSAGTVEIDGRPVEGPNARFIKIFQEYGLFPWRSVLGNVEYGLEARGVPRHERREKARRYLALVGLGECARQHPGELSGGMRQRVALARALAVEPEVLFMDEPFGALDALTRIQMQRELLHLRAMFRATIVLVTHDIDEGLTLADRVVVMGGAPGRVMHILPVALPRPRDRASGDFALYRRAVLRELFPEDAREELGVAI